MNELFRDDKITILEARIERVKIGRRRRTLEFLNCNCGSTVLIHEESPINTDMHEVVCCKCKDKGQLKGKVFQFTFDWANSRKSNRFVDGIEIPAVLRVVPFSAKMARKLNRMWCKRFNLQRCKVMMMNWKKFKKYTGRRSKRVYGVHSYTKKRIYLRKDVNESDMWPVFIHEVAHYRERGHTKQFGEEVMAIAKYFEFQLQRLMNNGKLKLPELASACNGPKKSEE